MLSGNEDAGAATGHCRGANEYLLKLPAKEDLSVIRAHAAGPIAPIRSPRSCGAARCPDADQTLDREVIALFCDRTAAWSPFARALIVQLPEMPNRRLRHGDAVRTQNGEVLRMNCAQPEGKLIDRGAKRLAACAAVLTLNAARTIGRH